jgi:excisionase family DNA binding protein
VIRNRTDNSTAGNLDPDPNGEGSLSVDPKSIVEPQPYSESSGLIQANPFFSLGLQMVQALEKIEQHLAFLRTNQQCGISDWLTISEAATELKVSEDTIQRLVGYGKLKAAEIETPMGKGQKKRHRIHRDWIKEYMVSNVKQVSITPVVSRTHSPRRQKGKIDFIR